MDITVEELTDTLGALVPRMGEMGITITRAVPGHVVAEVGMDGNANHLGTMYAGTLFGVAEVLGGVICVPSFDLARFYPTVKALTIDFRRPATTAVRAEASLTEEAIARIRDLAEATGKAEFVLDAVIADAGGEVVATTTGTYQLRATGPARA
ncbi:YiiD C-terminal domain-containing protein [Nocardioides sp. NPDC000445]|uniref:PaaI family thioesterase n=1 Tax=Nocardioides sp. NPDC000445 TaxID=3154257 RepID=UPI00331BC5F9